MKVFFVLTSILALSMAEDTLLKKYAEGSSKFTSKLHQQLVKADSSANLVSSPFSASTILALTSLGANGDTQKELTSALNLPSTNEEIQSTFKEILPNLKKGNPRALLLSANKVFLQKNFVVEPEFKKAAQDVFLSDVENVDFSKNVETASHINNWVEQQTNNKIQNLIPQDKISSDTKVVLVNALYFKGEWTRPFHLEDTTERDFYQTKEKIVKVPTMKKSDFLNYAENKELGAKFLELKYGGSDVTFTIVLPDEINGLSSLENNLEQVLSEQKFNRTVVKVFLPKFKVESEIDVKAALKQMGVQKIFETSADLTGISKDVGLYVTDVVQKAFLEVGELGTEAAAATAVISNARSLGFGRQSKVEFKVDRPFLFFLKQNNIVLFSGRVTKFN